MFLYLFFKMLDLVCNFISDSLPSTMPAASEDLESSISVRRRDSGIGEEPILVSGCNSETGAGTDPVSSGPDAISEVLHTLSSEVRKPNDTVGDGNGEQSSTKNVNVKDILRSLVSSSAEESLVDPNLLPPTFLGALGDPAAEHSVQFRSFDRYGCYHMVWTRKILPV